MNFSILPGFREVYFQDVQGSIIFSSSLNAYKGFLEGVFKGSLLEGFFLVSVFDVASDSEWW